MEENLHEVVLEKVLKMGVLVVLYRKRHKRKLIWKRKLKTKFHKLI